jgi:hypothetical protein
VFSTQIFQDLKSRYLLIRKVLLLNAHNVVTNELAKEVNIICRKGNRDCKRNAVL